MAIIMRIVLVIFANMILGAATTVADSTLRVVLEEPVAGETHGGVGNLRGWAVASEGIEKIEIWIDGAYAFDAPYGGARGDVRAALEAMSAAPSPR